MDAAPPHSAARLSTVSPQAGEQPNGIAEPASFLKELSGLEIDDLSREADADSVDLTNDELATILLRLGIKYNYGLAPGVSISKPLIATFLRALHLEDLALAHACALGRDAAWERFVARFREPLRRAAIGITASATLGPELADSLYAELFGLAKHGQPRRSPLATYSGRGSLMGFLRASLAQRSVDRHRRAGRETPIADEDPPAVPVSPGPEAEVLSRIDQSVTAMMSALEPEERLLLSAWFLDGRTLLEISRVVKVHEATVSRRIQRLTARLHKELLKNLQASGMSRAAAEEALGTDPRDLQINLRTLLQTSRPASFLEQEASGEPEQI